MKVLKSEKEMAGKKQGGKKKVTTPLTAAEAASSYEAYPDDVKCDGTQKKLTINGEDYYRWVFYPQIPSTDEYLPKHIQKNLANGKRMEYRYDDDLEQERYEWFCGGWVQFYDDILRPDEIRPDELKGKEHKLLFCWKTKDMPGVAIYINDKYVQDYEIKLEYDRVNRKTVYTAPPVVDPPTVPPPPPPSKS